MKKNRKILLLAAVCLLSLTVMVLALCRGGTGAAFVPPPFESAAQSGVPEVPEGLGYQVLDVRDFRVGLCGEVRVREGEAELWFTNPQGNAVWLKLRIMDKDGQVMGQTGLLRPGEYVRRVTLAAVEPGTELVLKVMAYEPDTYYSAGALEFYTDAVAG